MSTQLELPQKHEKSDMAADQNMKKGDQEFLFLKNWNYCKWFDNRSATMLLSNFERTTTTSNFLRRPKDSASNVQTVCPDALKMHNQGMGGIDLVNNRL